MPQPLFVNSAGFSAGFASSISGSFNVGSDPVTILAFGVVTAAASAVRMDSLTLNPGGTPIVMTPGTDRSLIAEIGAHGRMRPFTAIATGLTGTVNFTGLCTDLSGVSDGNGRPGVRFAWYKDVETVPTQVSQGLVTISGSGTFTSSAVASAANQTVAGLLLFDAGSGSVISGTGGTVLNGSVYSSDYLVASLDESGAASTTLQLAVTSTSSYLGHMWNLVGATTTPTLTLPTSTTITATTATVGATTDFGTGDLSVVVTTSATQPSVAQIKAGQNHLSTVMPAGQRSTITVGATGAQTFGATGLTQQTVYYAHWVHNVVGGDSNVLSSALFTTLPSLNLTSATGVPTGTTTASIDISTDTNNGTLYRLVSVNPTETVGTVKGSGATSTVTATGSQGPFSVTGLTASTTYYAHFVQNASGVDSVRVSSSAFTTGAPDAIAPTLTGVVTPSAIGANTATISWNAGADNVAVVGYDYRLNGGSYVSLGNVLTTNLTGLVSATLYNVDVRARDAAGNVSTPVITGSFTTTDNVAPTLSGTITVSALTSTSYTLTSPVASDNVAVTAYQYNVNASGWTTISAGGLSVSVTGRTPGSTDSVQMRALDAVANASVPLTISVSLSAAPVIGVQPSNQTVQAPTAATFTVSGVSGLGLTYQWQLSIGAGFAAIIGATSPSYVTPATSVSGGNANSGYQYRVVVTDSGGSTVTSTAATLTVNPAPDAVLPTLTGSISVSGVTTTGYTITYPAGADNVGIAGYEYSLNGGTYVSVGNTLTAAITGRTPNTTDVVTVRAFDAAGNRSTPALATSVDILAGTASVTSEELENLSGSLALNATVRWNWWPLGRAGALRGVSAVQGTTTSNALTGTVTVTGLPAGRGLLMTSVHSSIDSDDAIHLQYLTAV